MGDSVRVGAAVGAAAFAWWMAWHNTPDLDGVDNAATYRVLLMLACFSSAMTWLEWLGIVERY